MNPTTVCCPNLTCHARGHTGQGTMRMPSRRDQRCMGTACHKTCTATQGPAFYRLRTAAETVSLVVTLRAHGCPVQALVVACGSDERTGAWWLARPGVQGQASPEHVVEHPQALGQGQAEERRVKKQGGMVGMALAMLVSTRVWLAGAVRDQRDRPLIRRLIERVRAGALHRPLLCCPDGVCSSVRALRETLRDSVRTGTHGRPRLRPWRHVCIAQVVKRSAQRRVVAIARRLLEGPPARVETLRRRAHGEGVINPADIERLNATFRERLAALTRRGRALARRTLTLQHGMDLLGTVSNYCPPHASLVSVGRGTTPAMAAGITEHGWTTRERLSFHVPPPRWTPPVRRGRRSQVLQRVMTRWCV